MTNPSLTAVDPVAPSAESLLSMTSSNISSPEAYKSTVSSEMEEIVDILHISKGGKNDQCSPSRAPVSIVSGTAANSTSTDLDVELAINCLRSQRTTAYSSIVASGGGDRAVRIWHLKGGKHCLFEGHSDEICSVAFAPDSRHVSSSSDDGTVRIWNIESGSCVRILEVASEVKSGATGATWFPSGRHIGTVDGSGPMKLRDVETGQLERIPSNIGLVRSTFISRQGILVLIGGTHIFISDFASVNEANMSLLMADTRIITTTILSQDGRTLVFGRGDGSILLWDRISNSIMARLNGHSGAVCSLMFLSNQELVSASWDGTVRFWQLDVEMELKGSSLNITNADKRGHTLRVRSLVFTSLGSFIFSADSDGGILRWDSATGECAVYLEVPAITIAISPNDRQLAVVNGDLRVYDLSDTNEPKEERVDKGAVEVAYSPCGRWMASGDDKGAVRL